MVKTEGRRVKPSEPETGRPGDFEQTGDEQKNLDMNSSMIRYRPVCGSA